MPFLLLFLLLSGCAALEPAAQLPRPTLSGPSLPLAGQYGDLLLEGFLDRTCMAGVGSLELHDSPSGNFACSALLDAPPNEKGRIKGLLTCSDRSSFLFTMRNLGPDQGFGVGRSPASPHLLVFFYHPSPEEAARRLQEILSDINQANLLQEREKPRSPENPSGRAP
ncbi:MAG: hypothetical protein LBJ82_03185 [Deltaproteobacteria bacterium]|jgi:hypothetical protein|nr:hypothetical protein [Deltaproteobacteria bacterium]